MKNEKEKKRRVEGNRRGVMEMEMRMEKEKKRKRLGQRPGRGILSPQEW